MLITEGERLVVGSRRCSLQEGTTAKQNNKPDGASMKSKKLRENIQLKVEQNSK